LKLSEQQFVDCAGGSYGNEGCNGGDETVAMQYAMKYAVELEDTYPYTAEDDSCAWKKTDGKVLVTKVNVVPPNNAQQLLAAIAQAPVTVAVEADTDFQFYNGGVLNDPDCGTNLDHAILAVGYDQKGGYYIVRNSWGEDWGENGYIRLAITKNDAGICGVQNDPSWPVAN
jgi:C1A family cysteine protease